MASEHRMIEPFSPQQVRTAGDQKIVSYGTSSYGYDVRCADEFKIFTNINSTIVDPKGFDEKSFVDFKGPVCIIPPNSFALASTVEYFRIPRTILTVCLGKCVTGDTRVVDAGTGAYVPITEMGWGKSTLAWNGRRMQRAKVSAFMAQGKREIFELRTRAGLRIRATANHPFLALNKWVPLSDLGPGDRIAVAREIPVFGKTPVPDRLATLLGVSLGLRGAAEKFVPQSIFTAPERSVRLFLQSLFSGEAGHVRLVDQKVSIEYDSTSRRLIEDVRHLLLRFGILSLIRDEATAASGGVCKLQIREDEQIRRFAQRVGLVPGSVRQGVLEDAVRAISVQAPLAVRAMPDGSEPRVARGARFAVDADVTAGVEGPVWDEVERIEPAGVEEVFDITVPGPHNFVANDFIVHNSTYARCFRGDTRVALVDGTAPTLEEMAARHDSGELFWGYSIGQNGRLIVSLLDKPRFIGRDSLLQIELDNGEQIRATPDHLFMRRDGRMTAAHSLRPGDALMPLYRDLVRGYESVYQPIDGHLCPTQRLVDEWNVRHEIYADVPGTHRRHMDFDRRNNRPTNIERMMASRHADPSERARQSNLMVAAWAADGGVIAPFTGSPAHRNHKVAALREMDGDHDVYCLTVPEAGNFALQSGVFVHNCGIIVNVTPLEPEWEGHVTLEFSNTTPLPAKIYANEGVAQMLFFESDEVCETSYKDRGGKYQGQRGVTLPKT